MKNFLMNSGLLITAGIILIFMSACSENTEIQDTDTVTDNSVANSLFDLELTEREIAFIEDILDKDFDTITQDDIDSCNVISIVGNHVISEFYWFSGYPNESYYINDTNYDIGPDYSEYIHLLKYFPEITSLSLHFQNGLTDASFLQFLPKLETLWICGSKIDDLSILINHEYLRELHIEESPLKKLEIHKAAKLEIVTLNGTFFGDLSVLKNQTNLIGLSITRSFVPIVNTDILTEFETLNTLHLVAPECDYSFFDYMSVSIPNIVIGGYDNIDLTPLKWRLSEVSFFELCDSNGSDLTLLDLLPDDATIYLAGVEPGIRGEKTTDGYVNLKTKKGRMTETVEYYKLYLPEFLPEEFK